MEAVCCLYRDFKNNLIIVNMYTHVVHVHIYSLALPPLLEEWKLPATIRTTKTRQYS